MHKSYQTRDAEGGTGITQPQYQLAFTGGICVRSIQLSRYVVKIKKETITINMHVPPSFLLKNKGDYINPAKCIGPLD